MSEKPDVNPSFKIYYNIKKRPHQNRLFAPAIPCSPRPGVRTTESKVEWGPRFRYKVPHLLEYIPKKHQLNHASVAYTGYIDSIAVIIIKNVKLN